MGRQGIQDDKSGRRMASYEPRAVVASAEDAKMHVLGPVRMQQNDPNPMHPLVRDHQQLLTCFKLHQLVYYLCYAEKESLGYGTPS